MNKIIWIFCAIIMIQGCQSTPKAPKRLSISTVSLDNGEGFFCEVGQNTYLLAKDKVLKSDSNGKEYDQLGVIIGVERKLMKDKSINYSIRIATRDVFAHGKVPEYSYRMDDISFNSEEGEHGGLSPEGYVISTLYIPTASILQTITTKNKAYCILNSDGYRIMTKIEKKMNFNDKEAF